MTVSAQDGTGAAVTFPTYSRAAVVLHWLSALLIITLWPLGKLMVANKEASWSSNAIRIHTVIGLTVGVLTVIRLIVHRVGPKIEDLDLPRWERVLFRLNHLGLYAAVTLAVATGLLMYREAGASLLLNDGTDPRVIGKDNDWADRHGLPATLILVLFAMHLAGVVFHQVTRGRTLRRMGVPVGAPVE